MALNSLDVQNKTFNTQMRGYNKHEIEEFLDIVVRDYDEFAQKIKDQERELKALRERVKYFDDMKDSLNKSIVVAQDAADNLRVQAQSESNSIIAEASQKGQLIIEAAKKEAGTILNQASDDARRLVRDTDDLKRKMRLYHQRMTSIIEAQLASIHSEDWQDTLEATSSHITNPEEKLQEIVDMQLSDTSLQGNIAKDQLSKAEENTVVEPTVKEETEKIVEVEVEETEIPQTVKEVLAPALEEETEKLPSEDGKVAETEKNEETSYPVFPEMQTEVPEVEAPEHK
ncbi:MULTISPECIES: DivIVA domain-containing protein [Lactococcus]|uniref:DivIVA domain-containing protein n=1 Tax=Lactococcus TaxID=1357 RepID=UPI0013FD9809|nr:MULTISPECIES: DivIVA domain-containing protein [Lactococcus]MCH1712746.1 DivIVA domain-containing protein [Lactococcus petauri]NHI76091.1 DivIVA domain-containing protein [Lactococcus petauri]QSR04170.1 DivIVA domain-containing protein [Lactococcus sp. LG1267]QSR10497.1 DivIVA domain-containing protein [Lactococcus sp. LG592]